MTTDLENTPNAFTTSRGTLFQKIAEIRKVKLSLKDLLLVQNGFISEEIPKIFDYINEPNFITQEFIQNSLIPKVDSELSIYNNSLDHAKKDYEDKIKCAKEEYDLKESEAYQLHAEKVREIFKSILPHALFNTMAKDIEIDKNNNCYINIEYTVKTFLEKSLIKDNFVCDQDPNNKVGVEAYNDLDNDNLSDVSIDNNNDHVSLNNVST